MRLVVVPAPALEGSLAELLRHVSKDGKVEIGLPLDNVPSKTTVWQLKAKLMEFTGIPPVHATICTSPQGKPAQVKNE
jgi:hypothetical protein